MKVVIYSSDLNIIYENSILFINYFYQGFLNIITSVNL